MLKYCFINRFKLQAENNKILLNMLKNLMKFKGRSIQSDRKISPGGVWPE